MFSTLEDGKIVEGLAGVPNEGPVLLVGYHMLMGLELGPLVERFLIEKNTMVRGLAHPALFSRTFESSSSEFFFGDWVKVFGAVPVTASNLFKLLSTKSYVLLYPGGAREALHYKVCQVPCVHSTYFFPATKKPYILTIICHALNIIIYISNEYTCTVITVETYLQ
jgi:hypothetical protein